MSGFEVSEGAFDGLEFMKLLFELCVIVATQACKGLVFGDGGVILCAYVAHEGGGTVHGWGWFGSSRKSGVA